MKRSQLTLIDGCFMFGFSLGELMILCPDERLFFVLMISAMLRRSGGDAGAVMFEAYRHIVSDTNQARRSCMRDLLESVRHDYVHGGYT
ncbi:hypothetical protein [Salmonella enterica]|uniref:hypothetical protein n=1 Tax=Salmonella enterica TaxID=28901 RepID=UPI002150DA26|nr:hypothetical protein [Salmonella enterica]